MGAPGALGTGIVRTAGGSQVKEHKGHVMVTNYPQVLVTSDGNTRSETRLTVAGLMEAAIRRVGQVACGVRGHEMLWHYERNRVMLECGRCGHASKGWDVSGSAAPTLRYAGDSRRHELRPLKIATRRSA
jgi:hypothetical protein